MHSSLPAAPERVDRQPTLEAAARFERIRSQQPTATLLEVHPDGGIEFSMVLGGHHTAFAIDPQGGKAVMLG